MLQCESASRSHTGVAARRNGDGEVCGDEDAAVCGDDGVDGAVGPEEGLEGGNECGNEKKEENQNMKRVGSSLKVDLESHLHKSYPAALLEPLAGNCALSLSFLTKRGISSAFGAIIDSTAWRFEGTVVSATGSAVVESIEIRRVRKVRRVEGRSRRREARKRAVINA